MIPLKMEPKFKMNTCFYSDVLWLHLGYKISTLMIKGIDHSCSLRTNLVSFRTLFPPNQLCPGLFYRNLQQDGSRYEIPTVILPHSASISTMYSLFKSSKGLLLQNFCQTCLVLLMNSGVKVTCPQVIYPKHSKH